MLGLRLPYSWAHLVQRGLARSILSPQGRYILALRADSLSDSKNEKHEDREGEIAAARSNA
jgi:hypothetical protein